MIEFQQRLLFSRFTEKLCITFFATFKHIDAIDPLASHFCALLDNQQRRKQKKSQVCQGRWRFLAQHVDLRQRSPYPYLRGKPVQSGKRLLGGRAIIGKPVNNIRERGKRTAVALLALNSKGFSSRPAARRARSGARNCMSAAAVRPALTGQRAQPERSVPRQGTTAAAARADVRARRALYFNEERDGHGRLGCHGGTCQVHSRETPCLRSLKGRVYKGASRTLRGRVKRAFPSTPPSRLLSDMPPSGAAAASSGRV